MFCENITQLFTWNYRNQKALPFYEKLISNHFHRKKNNWMYNLCAISKESATQKEGFNAQWIVTRWIQGTM